MRTTITLTLFLLVAAFAVAQQPRPRVPTDQGAPQIEQGRPNPQNRPGAVPGESQLPAVSVPAGETDTVEGCLGGTAPDFTVTDEHGSAYHILIPPGADSSKLTQHVGESVQVQGAFEHPGSRTGTPGSVAGSTTAPIPGAGELAIRAQRISRGTTTCPGNRSTSTTPTPPKK